MNQNNTGFLSSIPPVTRNIILINLICFFAQYLFMSKGVDISNFLGLHFYMSDGFSPYQLITYMFMHSTQTFTHVLFNMFAVFIFGRTLEMVWGGKKFLIYYMLTGIGAAIAQELIYTIELRELIFNPAIDQIRINSFDLVTRQELFNMLPVTVGASGAVFGILLAFGMLFPNAKMIIIPIPIPIKAKWFVAGYGLIELGLGIANSAGDSVAHFAHLGGLLTGLIIVLYWKKKGNLDGTLYR